MKRIKQFFQNLGDILLVGVIVAWLVAMAAMLLRIFAPLSPVLTTIFFLVIFCGGMSHTRQTRMMSFGGLAIYALSWALVPHYGMLVASAVCVFGFVTFFQAGLTGMFTPMPSPARLRA